MEILALIGLSALGSVAGLLGGAIFIIKKKWARALTFYAVPFAAGVLLSVSLLHLIPEANHAMGEGAFLVVLLSLLGSFFFEQYFAHMHHHEENKTTSKGATIPLVLFGDTVHNFIDGVAIASAFMAQPFFGLIIALATFLHETPHEIGDFGILLKNGWEGKKALLANFISSLATFPGAILTYYYIADAHDKVGVLLAVSAGVFLYLGASDFLPEVGEAEDKKTVYKKIIPLVIGVSLMYFLRTLTPEH